VRELARARATKQAGQTGAQTLFTIRQSRWTFVVLRHTLVAVALFPPRGTVKALLLGFGLLFITAGSAVAQNTVTAQRVGNTTYYSGTVNGQSVSGTTQVYGTTAYTNLRVGSTPVNTTAQTFGNTTYTQTQLGQRSYSSTAQTYGNTTYRNSSTGSNSTAQTFGNTTYTSTSSGGRSTSQTFGNTTYTTTTPATTVRCYYNCTP
jgi:hypothetical protein